MRTFAIRNGDFVLAPGGLEMVSGQAKTIQDLGIAIREPYGSDRFHPDWGTLLHDYLGLPGSEHVRMMIEAEVIRVVQNYIVQQGQMMEADAIMGRPSRFLVGEVIIDISSVSVVQLYDRFYVKVDVVSVSGDTIPLVRAVA